MKFALSDEIWRRLYGPYGNRSVNKLLVKLSENWDSSVADELYWEELHHQDDVYPATYAALPWLVELSSSSDGVFQETHLFLSHVIHCACIKGGTGCDGKGPRGKYRGLSTDVSIHHHAWIPESEWLTAEDQHILIKLERWFSDNCSQIAERCLKLVGPDPVISAHAIEGFATLNGSSKVAWSTQMFADGEEVGRIQRGCGDYDERDTIVVARLYPHLRERNPELASFLLGYPGCTYVPHDPGQGSLV